MSYINRFSEYLISVTNDHWSFFIYRVRNANCHRTLFYTSASHIWCIDLHLACYRIFHIIYARLLKNFMMDALLINIIVDIIFIPICRISKLL